MRNLFDQYTHPENRLTHALVSSIAQDQYLLREFIAAREYPEALLRGRERNTLCNKKLRSLMRSFL
jgi:hypothetical protein